MKIIEDGLGFLQRYDVAFILDNWSIAMPKEVIKEIYSFAIRKPASKYAQKISHKSIKGLNHPKENSHIVWHFPKAEGPL